MKNMKMMLASLMLAAGVAGSASGAVLYYETNEVMPRFQIHSYDPSTGVLTTNNLAGPLRFWNNDYYLDALSDWEWLTLSGFGLNLLTGGDPINGTSGVWSTEAGFIGQAIGSTNFWGVRFDDGYGWLHVAHTEDRVLTLLASGFNPDGEILAGQTSLGGGGNSAIPEPGTMVLLAFGLGGAGLLRRRMQGANPVVVDSNQGRTANRRPRTTYYNSNSSIYG